MPLMQFLCVSTGSCSPAYFRYGIAAIIPPGRDGLLMIWGLTPTHKRLPLSGFLKKRTIFTIQGTHKCICVMSADGQQRFSFISLSASVPARHYKLGYRNNNELLYLYSAFVPGRRFSNALPNAKLLNVSLEQGNIYLLD